MLSKNSVMHCIVILAWGIFSFAADDTPRYKGPFEDLVEIPLMKTDSLEAMVAKQIKGYQKSLLRLGQLEPADPVAMGRAYGILGQAYHAYEWIAPARRCYLNAAQLNPQAFSWQYLLGLTEMEMGNTLEAEANFKKALEIRPDYHAASIHLANLYLNSGQASKSEELFKAVLEANPNSPAAWVGLGRTYQDLKDHQKALESFANAAKLAPSALKINYYVAMTYRQMGETETARKFMKRAGKTGVTPVDPLLADVKRLQRGENVFIQRGQRAFAAGNYEKAANFFQLALNSNANSIPARINLGTCLGVMGQAEEAIKQFQAALSKDPKNVTAHFNLGKIYAAGGQHETAITHFDYAIAEKTDDLDFFMNKAYSLSAMGRDDQAMSIYTSIDEQMPEYVAAPVAIVNLLLKQKKFDETLVALGNYRQRFPSDARLGQYQAQLLVGHPSLAKRDGKKALEIALQLVEAVKSPLYMQTVAMAYAEIGKCERAAKWQEKALEMFREANAANYVPHAEKQLKNYQKGGDCRIPGQ